MTTRSAALAATFGIAALAIGSSACTTGEDYGGARVTDSATPTTLLQPGTPSGETTGGTTTGGTTTGGTTTGGTTTGGTTTGGTTTGTTTGGTTTGTTTGGTTTGTTTGGTGTGTTGTTGTGTGGTGTGTGGGTGTPTFNSCDPVIPANAIVVDTDTPHTTSNATYWVCAQNTLSLTANDSVVILDDSGEVVINGTGNTVYMQSNSGLVLFDDGNLVIHEAGAAINDETPYETNVLQSCLTIVPDLTNAPTPGC